MKEENISAAIEGLSARFPQEAMAISDIHSNTF